MKLEEMNKGFGTIDEGDGAFGYPPSHLFRLLMTSFTLCIFVFIFKDNDI